MAQIGNYVADASNVEGEVEIIPAGEYPAIITESDYVPTKSGNGMILKLTWTIIDGEYKGRKVFENLNLANQNPQAVQIAKAAFNSILFAVGLQGVQDSAQLHNKPVLIKVKVKPETAEYSAKNEVKKHTAMSGAAPTGGAPQFTPGQPATPSVPPTGGAAGAPAKKRAWEQ